MRESDNLGEDEWLFPLAEEDEAPPRRGTSMPLAPPRACPDEAALAPGGDRALPAVFPLARLHRSRPWEIESVHATPHHRVIHLARGQGRALLDGRMRGIGANHLLFIPAGTPAAFHPLAGANGEWLTLPVDTTLPWPANCRFLPLRGQMRQGEALALIEGIERELADDAPGREIALAAEIARLAVLVLRLEAEHGLADAEPDRNQQLVLATLAFIERHHAEGIGAGDVAEALGVTPAHLSRVCREATGHPVSELVHERILLAARRLLLGTDLPVGVIARCLGFASAAYFSRFFSARTALSPRAWRQRHRR